jgi:hypothetical protein
MLYLITGEPRETVFSAGPEQLAGFIESTVAPSLESLDRLAREKVVTGGVFTAKPGFAMVVDVQSHEELHKLLTSLPFAATTRMTVEPLVPFSTGTESVRGVARNIKASIGRSTSI